MKPTEEYTPDECVALLTEWAATSPSARFVVIAIAPDGTDAALLGWGLALPDYAFTHLPELGLHGAFRSADHLLRLLNRTLHARIAWIDPTPETWPEA
ncbi:hypothetical protein [Actinophytocola gossypii]|uniref:Uncharacterized protein n=1 Tax=Actinophytocola gossypii TaxID=2812003 RepID=A0ABT2JEZ3_9PSEU|nr:hypothetical protein [Actinophytocola gossypii]MCT2586430.1 hypothetical protein [Actinophytocola gossypii]